MSFPRSYSPCSSSDLGCDGVSGVRLGVAIGVFPPLISVFTIVASRRSELPHGSTGTSYHTRVPTQPSPMSVPRSDASSDRWPQADGRYSRAARADRTCNGPSSVPRASKSARACARCWRAPAVSPAVCRSTACATNTLACSLRAPTSSRRRAAASRCPGQRLAPQALGPHPGTVRLPPRGTGSPTLGSWPGLP